MRLLIVGTLEGHITTAGKIAMSRSAKVSHVDTIEDALTPHFPDDLVIWRPSARILV